MRRIIIIASALTIAIFPAGTSRGQFGVTPPAGVPAVPAVPGAAAPSAAAAAPGAVAGVPAGGSLVPTLPEFLGLSKTNLAACREKFCQTPLATFGSNMMGPLSLATGGLFAFNCCPPPTPADFLGPQTPGAPPNGAQAVAAAVAADEAQAKARVAAIEYLATVDCRYWPDAAQALAESLRADKNECVRFAAAKALGSGCCCNKVTIEALKIVVSGTNPDGFPAEHSDRVKAAAFYALQRCLLTYVEPPPEPGEPPAPSRPGEPPAPSSSGRPEPNAALTSLRRVAVPSGSYYEAVDQSKPQAMVIAEARRALADPGNHPLAGRTLPTGHRSVYHAFVKAATPGWTPPGSSPPALPDPPPGVPTTSRDRPAPPRPTPPTRRADTPNSSRQGDGDRSLFGLIRQARFDPSAR